MHAITITGKRKKEAMKLRRVRGSNGRFRVRKGKEACCKQIIISEIRIKNKTKIKHERNR